MELLELADKIEKVGDTELRSVEIRTGWLGLGGRGGWSSALGLFGKNCIFENVPLVITVIQSR